MKNSKIVSAIICCALTTLGSCQLDSRIGDLNSSYDGAFIDKVTGDTVATEYYGSYIKLLDLKYGDRAVPLEYGVNPEGKYNNDHFFPSEYKVWATGPFFELDTLYLDFDGVNKKIDLLVSPNMRLSIDNINVQYGIAAEITYSYELLNPDAEYCNVGLVYSTTAYPGYKTAMDESNTTALVKKRINSGVVERKGTFTETLYLDANKNFYIRALGKSDNAGDYWNYSKQIVIHTGDIDISSMPIEARIGVSSATSAILNWSFPPLVDEIKLSYTDKDGAEVNDSFTPEGYSYVANLNRNTDNVIKVKLVSGSVESPERTITVKTKSLDDKYVPAGSNRPETVPFYNDVAFKRSLSTQWAEILSPVYDPGWATSTLRYEFFDWWNTWLLNNAYMPSCGDIENFKELTLWGDVKTLVDILPFVNVETLNIMPGTLFDEGVSMSSSVDLTVLRKLKKLKKVVLDKGVALTQIDFNNAGLNNIQVVRQ